MARAAMPALNWLGSNSIFTTGLTSKSSSATNLTDSMDEISALHSMSIGARGRLASISRVSLGGRRDDDGTGGAEQYASRLSCLRFFGMKKVTSFPRIID